MTPERRGAARTRLGKVAYVHLEEGGGGIVVNISETGLAFHLAAPVAQSGDVHIRFSLVGGQRIEAAGELMWTDAGRKVGGMRFTALSQRDRERIRLFVAEAEAPRIAPPPPEERAPRALPAMIAAAAVMDIAPLAPSAEVQNEVRNEVRNEIRKEVQNTVGEPVKPSYAPRAVRIRRVRWTEVRADSTGRVVHIPPPGPRRGQRMARGAPMAAAFLIGVLLSGAYAQKSGHLGGIASLFGRLGSSTSEASTIVAVRSDAARDKAGTAAAVAPAVHPASGPASDSWRDLTRAIAELNAVYDNDPFARPAPHHDPIPARSASAAQSVTTAAAATPAPIRADGGSQTMALRGSSAFSPAHSPAHYADWPPSPTERSASQPPAAMPEPRLGISAQAALAPDFDLYYDVGEYRDTSEASREVAMLSRYGVRAISVRRGHWMLRSYHVLAGPYDSDAQAEAADKRLESLGFEPRFTKLGAHDPQER